MISQIVLPLLQQTSKKKMETAVDVRGNVNPCLKKNQQHQEYIARPDEFKPLPMIGKRHKSVSYVI